jgi:predicted small metal-binding protein
MKEFKEWLKTKSGGLCNDLSTLDEQPYLENRLHSAFEAGFECHEAFKRMNGHIKELHHEIKILKNYNNKLKRELRKK